MIEPDLLYTVLCDQVRREDNGKLMLIGLFDQITVGTFPATHPAFAIVNKWRGGVGSFTQHVRFVDDDDATILEDQPVSFECSLDNAFTAIQLFNGVTLQREGNIWIEILLNNELKLRYPVLVSRAPRSIPSI